MTPKTPSLRSEPRWIKFVDLVALILLLLTVWVLVVGGFHFEIGPLPISVTSWARAATEAAVVLVLRYGLTGPLVPTRASRLRFVLAYGLLLVTLACSSNLRRVGDGAEYLAMALNLSRLHPPAISGDEMRGIERTFAAIGDGFAGRSLVNPDFRGADGRQDLIHFWLYPLLASPWVWVARALALPATACFVFVNIPLLVLALWIVSGHIRHEAALLLFVGPIIWWSDKGHTEAFTFALLAIAVTLVSAAPWWSLVALGAAAAQNPGIALTVPLVALVALATRPGVWRDGRFWAGAVAGASLAALHPLYYWARLGRPSLLFGATLRQMPSFAVWSAPLIDPNIGVFATFPWLTLALAVALVIVMRRSPARLLDPSVLVALAASALFVVSFSQIPNVNSGGTPGMSRYGLWIVPMALPIFAQYDAVARRPHVAWLAALAVASSIWCVVYFRPETGEDYGTPSPLADLLWTRYPSINNPLPEIFAERVMGVGDNSWLPAVTSRCEKVLLRGRGTNAEPLWPVPCAPAVVPPTCRPADALCYANRRGDGYSFAEAPRQPGYELRDAGTWLWTGVSAPAVRTALPEVDWSALRIARFTDPAPMVRRFERTAWVSMLQSDAQFVVYLARPDADAVLRIESATPMGGRIVDPATGETLRKIPSDATRFLTIKVPGPRAEAVAILTRSDRKSTIVGR